MDGIYWTKGARERVRASYRTLLASSSIPLQELRIPTRFGETCVLTCGPALAPPLLLLHGGNTNSAMWLPSFPVWSKHFRVYAVDTIGDPGFSATTRPSLHGDEHALWIEDVLGGLHLEHTSIIGASLGGWIGLDFALRHPGVVSSLVLFAPGGITGLRGMIRLEITCLMLMGAWGRRRALLRMFGLLDSSLTDDQRAFLAFCGVAQLNVLSRIRVPAPIVDERLKMLSVRTLVVLGGRDIFFKTEVVRQRFQDLCSTVSVYVVPEAGHMAVDPTKFVQDFLLGHP